MDKKLKDIKLIFDNNLLKLQKIKKELFNVYRQKLDDKKIDEIKQKISQ